MEAVNWKMKSINPTVPLYDPEKKTYMIIVDGDPVDLPEDIFNKLFTRSEKKITEVSKPVKESTSTRPFNIFQARNDFKEVIRFYMKLGKSKSEIIYETLGKFKEKFNIDDYAYNSLENELSTIYSEIEGEK